MTLSNPVKFMSSSMASQAMAGVSMHMLAHSSSTLLKSVLDRPRRELLLPWCAAPCILWYSFGASMMAFCSLSLSQLSLLSIALSKGWNSSRSATRCGARKI